MRIPFRGFISVDFPDVPGVVAFLRTLKDTGAPLKLVRPEIVHLTLKFLGGTEESLIPNIAEAMRRATEGVAPFRVRLAGAGAFPSPRRPNIVWVGIEGGAPLVSIANHLEVELEPLGFPREGRPFSPHVTLARVRERRGLEGVRAILESHGSDEFGEATVDSVRLKKSTLTPQGPEYRTVEEISLR